MSDVLALDEPLVDGEFIALAGRQVEGEAHGVFHVLGILEL